MIRLRAEPKGEWRRHHPTARRIAQALRQHAPVLALRWTTLIADIRARYRVGSTTAATAIRLARQEVQA